MLKIYFYNVFTSRFTFFSPSIIVSPCFFSLYNFLLDEDIDARVISSEFHFFPKMEKYVPLFIGLDDAEMNVISLFL